MAEEGTDRRNALRMSTWNSKKTLVSCKHEFGHQSGVAVAHRSGGAGDYGIRLAQTCPPRNLTASDPPLGTEVTLPPTDVFGQSIARETKSLIVYGGTCSGCTLNSVNPYRLRNAPFKQTIIVYLADRERVLAEVPITEGKVRVIADPNGLTVQQLRPESAPRFYIVEGSKLVSIWKETDKWPSSLTGERDQ